MKIPLSCITKISISLGPKFPVGALPMIVVLAISCLGCASMTGIDVDDSDQDVIRTVTQSLNGVKALSPADCQLSQIAGRYTVGNGRGLQGDEILLFPNHEYMAFHWSDMIPISIVDEGMWSATSNTIHFFSLRDSEHSKYPRGQEAFLFLLPQTRGECRLKLMKMGFPYFFFKMRIGSRDYSSVEGKRKLLELCTYDKAHVKPDWKEIAEYLLFFWNRRIERGRQIKEIPMGMEYQELIKCLRQQYR